jgi:hypothetical protein
MLKCRREGKHRGKLQNKEKKYFFLKSRGCESGSGLKTSLAQLQLPRGFGTSGVILVSANVKIRHVFGDTCSIEER